MRKRIFTFCLLLFSVMAIQAQWFVTEKGTGDGSSWTNASGDIQAMIDKAAAAGGGEVWVAKGVYAPTVKIAAVDSAGIPTTNRDKAFRLRPNVSLYGGFASEGSDFSSRDPKVYETVLSGALGTNEYAYHVVVAMGNDMGGAELDGFTITGGRAFITEDDPAPREKLPVIVLDEEGNEVSAYLFRDSGGALYVESASSLTLNNLKMTKNIAGRQGAFRITNITDIVLSNSIIEENETLDENSGGGFIRGYIETDNRLTAKISNVIVRNNIAKLRVGGLHLRLSRLEIDNLTVEHNMARETDIGGIYIQTCSVTGENIYIRNNTAPSYGGAFFQYIEDSSISNLVVTDNTTTDGMVGAINLNTCKDFSIDGLTVMGNKSAGSYAGISITATTSTTFENFIIADNTTAGGYAGAFRVGGESELLLKNGRIEKNHTESTGGGHLNLDINSTVKGINLLIADNTATKAQPGVHISSNCTLDLINCTIVNNTTEADATAGLAVPAGTTTLTNCIVWGNTKEGGVSANCNATITETDFTYSLVGGKDLTAQNGLNGITIVDPSIIFQNYTAGDYRLLAGSPAINEGLNTPFTPSDVDLDGYPRLVGTADLGAYEYQTEAENQIPFFTGGIMSGDIHTYTYNGLPIDLRLTKVAAGTTIEYIWTGSSIPSSTVDIVDAGEYTVTATVGATPYTATVVVEKAKLFVSLANIEMMVRALGVAPDTRTLTASWDTDVYGGSGLDFNYASSNPAYVTVSGNIATAVTSGSAVITMTAIVTDDDLKNYEIITGMAVATVTALTVSGGTEGNPVEIPVEDLEEGEDVIIEDGSVVTIPEGETLPGDVIIEGGDEGVIIEGDLNTDGDLIIEEGGHVNVGDGDVNVGGDVTFEGNVTFENGAEFTNEPVFKGDVTMSGTIVAPSTGLNFPDNDGKTITIDQPVTVSGDMSVVGGTLKLGELTVSGDLSLKGVTLDVSQGAVLDVEGDLNVAASPRSTIDLTQLQKGESVSMVITGIPGGDNPADLFNITVLGKSASSQGVTFSWVYNSGDDSWELKTTAATNIPDTSTPPALTYYTMKIHSVVKEGLRVSPGIGNHNIEANAYMSLDITLDTQHFGKRLLLVINGETIELTGSVAQTSYTHNLRFITRDMDIEIVLKEKTTTGNEAIGENEFKVYALSGALRVETGAPTDVVIYTVAGRPVAAEKVNGTKEFSLPAGIYIVRTASTSVKAAVR